MTDLLRSALPAEIDEGLLAATTREWIVKQAVDGLAEARRAPAYATVNLARWFRKNRSLGSRDRRVVADLVHGAIRHEALLLRAGAWDPEALIRGAGAIAAGERYDGLETHSPEEDFATALNVPAPVAGEWLAVLGAEAAAKFAASINRRPPVDIRVNTLKTDCAALQASLEEEGVETRIRGVAPSRGCRSGQPCEHRPSDRDTSRYKIAPHRPCAQHYRWNLGCRSSISVQGQEERVWPSLRGAPRFARLTCAQMPLKS